MHIHVCGCEHVHDPSSFVGVAIVIVVMRGDGGLDVTMTTTDHLGDTGRDLQGTLRMLYGQGNVACLGGSRSNQ